MILKGSCIRIRNCSCCSTVSHSSGYCGLLSCCRTAKLEWNIFYLPNSRKANYFEMCRCVASSKRLRYSAAYDIVAHSSERSALLLLLPTLCTTVRPSVSRSVSCWLSGCWLLASLSARLTAVGMWWGNDAAFFDNTKAARAQFTFMFTEE